MKQEDVQHQQEDVQHQDVQHQDGQEMLGEVIDDETALSHVTGSIAIKSNYAMVGTFTGAGAYMGSKV